LDRRQDTRRSKSLMVARFLKKKKEKNQREDMWVKRTISEGLTAAQKSRPEN